MLRRNSSLVSTLSVWVSPIVPIFRQQPRWPPLLEQSTTVTRTPSRRYGHNLFSFDFFFGFLVLLLSTPPLYSSIPSPHTRILPCFPPSFLPPLSPPLVLISSTSLLLLTLTHTIISPQLLPHTLGHWRYQRRDLPLRDIRLHNHPCFHTHVFDE